MFPYVASLPLSTIATCPTIPRLMLRQPTSHYLYYNPRLLDLEFPKATRLETRTKFANSKERTNKM